MKKNEILDSYKIDKFSFSIILKETILSLKSKGRTLLPLYLIFFIYFLGQDYLTSKMNIEITLLFNIVRIFMGLIISAYLIFTFLDYDKKSFDKERMICSISTLKGQIKTLLAGLTICLPALLLCIGIGIVFTLFSSVSTENPEFQKNMQAYYYIGVILILLVLVLFSSIYYATYITIIHKLTGFTAVKFSMQLFKKNIMGSLILFFIMVLLPLIITLIQESLNLSNIVLLFYIIINSSISFLSILFMSSLLTKTSIKNM